MFSWNGDLTVLGLSKACVLLVKDEIHVLRNGLIALVDEETLFLRGIAGKNKFLWALYWSPGIFDNL